jgi:hypothetical protein
MFRSRRFTASALIVAALLAAPALSGCGLVQGAIEKATGGQLDLGGKGVPKDFPSEVPIAEGEVLYGLSAGKGDEKVWNLTVRVSEGAFESISQQLIDAGFEHAEGSEVAAAGSGGLFNSDKWGVLVVVAEDGDNGYVANYTVSKSDNSP